MRKKVCFLRLNFPFMALQVLKLFTLYGYHEPGMAVNCDTLQVMHDNPHGRIKVIHLLNS